MFSLFYGLWKHLFSKAEFHVLILGIDKAGKTAILATLLEKLKSFYSNLEGLPPDRIVPTVGLNIGHIEASSAKLVFWDLGERVLCHEDLHGAPLLILANKQDLPGAVSAEDLARYLDLKKLDERLYMFEAASAYDGMGIRFSVEWLVDVMQRTKRTEILRIRQV